MTFEKWAAQYSWWKSGTQDALRDAWQRLQYHDVPDAVIEECFDAIVSSIQNEYGD